MVSHLPVEVRAAVEGNLDEAIVRRLVGHCGGQLGTVRGKRGRDYVIKHLRGYNNGARYGWLWFVLVDLDQDPECAPTLVGDSLPEPAAGMCFRVAVHEVEAWLLGDQAGFAKWSGVRRSLIPSDVEAVVHPKEKLVEIVRQSRRSNIREAIVPRNGSGRTEGPAYTSTLSEFVANRWDIEAAAQAAPSLERAIRCLKAKVASPPTSGQ